MRDMHAKAADIDIGGRALQLTSQEAQYHVSREENPLAATGDNRASRNKRRAPIPADLRPRTDATSVIETATPALVSFNKI